MCSAQSFCVFSFFASLTSGPITRRLFSVQMQRVVFVVLHYCCKITFKVLLTCLYFVYCQSAQAVPDFLTQFVPENIYES